MQLPTMMAGPPKQIAADGSICHCFEDMETCCFTYWTCMIWPFAVNRERAGVMACLPSAAMVGVAMLVSLSMAWYQFDTYSMPYQTCLMHHEMHHEIRPLRASCNPNFLVWQADPTCNPCNDQYSALQDFQTIQYAVSFVMTCYLCGIMGNNRSKLQKALGMEDAGVINYILCETSPLYLSARAAPSLNSRGAPSDAPIVSSFFGPCAQCQEARAVKSRWLANGQQPLTSGVQVPMQPSAAPGVYSQAPQ